MHLPINSMDIMYDLLGGMFSEEAYEKRSFESSDGENLPPDNPKNNVPRKTRFI